MPKMLLKETLFLRAYTFLKIPLVWWIRPTVISMDDQKMILRVPLNRRTKNHLGVMYFGPIAVGAEVCVAYAAMAEIAKSKLPVNLLFKDFSAQFLKKADGDVHFICEELPAVRELLQKAATTDDRQEQTFNAYAIVPSSSQTEVIGRFQLTLSLRRRQRK